jgi:hypothetical protein
MGAVLGEGQPVGFPCRRLTTPQLYIILRSNPFKRNDDGSRTAEPVDTERLKDFLSEFMLGEVWYNQGEEGLVKR